MRKTCTRVALALTLLGTTARAQSDTAPASIPPPATDGEVPLWAVAPAPGSAPLAAPPVFAYRTPAEPKGLRAVAEVGAVLTLGFAWYATTAPNVRRWDPGYRWSIFRQKITFENFTTDGNSLGTNFVGHPLGGTGYYLAARSNRLSIPVSFGLAVAGSFVWELFGEISEIISVNDMIVTPLAGVSIGEATTELASFLDRSPPTPANRIFGAVFGPLKTLNDRFDSLEPDRAFGPADEWHRFHLEGAFDVAREDAPRHVAQSLWPEGRLELTSELVRLPGYATTGGGGLWFDDGNVSSIALVMAGGTGGLTDLEFATNVVVAGGYYRRRGRLAGAVVGANGFGGVTSGFQYTVHRYRRGEARAIDRIATVRPLGFLFQQRSELGEPAVTTRLAFGPDFGGVTPNAIASYPGERQRLPYVEQARGYYFAVGGHLHAGVEVESERVIAAGALDVEALRSFRAPEQPSSVELADALARLRLSLGYRVPRTVLYPRAFAERRERYGWVGKGRVTNGEWSLGAGLGALF